MQASAKSGQQETLLPICGPIAFYLAPNLPYGRMRDLVSIASTSDNYVAFAASATLKIGSLADLLKLASTRAS
jgi:tripartite-type tricarboxylate transporter receptor subunit TctC